MIKVMRATATEPREALSILLLLLIVAVVYLPGLHGGFILDDYPNIVQNTSIQIEDFSFASLAEAANAYDGHLGRPLATISIALNYYFGGFDAFGFKLVNLLFHLFNVLLVFFLAQALLRQPAAGPNIAWSSWGPLIIAGAWALHPLQVSTVLYVIQRMEIVAVTFMLLALLAYLHGRNLQIEGRNNGWKWLVVSALMGLTALTSKEIAVLLPLLTLTIEWALLRFRSASPRDTRLLTIGYSVIVATGAALFFLVALPTYGDPARYAHRSFSLDERLLSQLRILPMYLSWMVWPTPDRLVFFYDHYPPSSGLLTPPSTLFGGLFLMALAALAWILRLRTPIASLGIAWFFISHLLTSNVFALELVFEHRNYFALLGFILAVGGLFRIVPALSRQLVPATAMLLISGFALLTSIQAATWGDRVNLAMHLAAVNPNSERAQTELGAMYAIMSDNIHGSPLYRSAVIRLEKSAALPNASPIPEQLLLILAAHSEAPAQQAWWDSLSQKLAERPIGSQERAAVLRLIENRIAGRAISDDGLKQVFNVLRKRSDAPPALFSSFGYYALRSLDDQEFALQAFIEGRKRLAADSPLFREWLETLAAGGYLDLANQLLQESG